VIDDVIDDPETLRQLKTDARRQLRARYQGLRAAFPLTARAERSQRIIERVVELEVYTAARSLGLFWPFGAEVDLRPLDERARAEQKKVFYPVLDPTPEGTIRTGFAEACCVAELVERGQRFAEPPADAPRAARGEIDLILVPALAVTDDGHRLGYGRGFYDVTLPDFSPPAKSLIVAFDFQLLAELPVFEHDFACDLVVTDSRVIRVDRARRQP
jgi:5-formyltetrahydrofolate cyclo-ligase